MKPHRFEHVDGAPCVDFKIRDGVRNAVCDGHLGGQVNHGTRLAYRVDYRYWISDIGNDDIDAFAVPRFQPLGIFANPGAGQIVQHDNFVAAASKTIGQVTTYEAAAACDKYGPCVTRVHHATSPRCNNSWVAFSARSSAI